MLDGLCYMYGHMHIIIDLHLLVDIHTWMHSLCVTVDIHLFLSILYFVLHLFL